MAALFRSKASWRPALPVGLRIYAISDIHGRADLLQELFAVIDNDLARSPPARAIHVFLGDYIDRGPASRQTIDLLVERGRRHESVFLKGNHEAVLLETLNDAAYLHNWGRFGGLQTLMSYGLRPSLNPDRLEQAELVQRLKKAMPAIHQQFFQHLRPSFECGDFYFAHAGIRPGVPLRLQSEADLLWIREEFLECEDYFEKYIVHGHTPVSFPDVCKNRINIDTGAYATDNLTLLSIERDSLIAL